MKMIILFLIIAGACAQGPMVKVKEGVLKGTWQLSPKGRRYALFEKVPYARPPTGEFRFSAPEPLRSWSGIRNATGPTPDCLQYLPFSRTVTGQEDCLFLNIFTPNIKASQPVMVFIHGGAFLFGGISIYNARFVMDFDMVVVSVNYRLGPLGFLSTQDDIVPGNTGLKDQSFALHWIQKNIAAFGGDPNSVTFTGNSAGASSVHYHLLSPLSRGTFARGILFSGSAFASWAQQVRPLQKAKRLAALVDCPTRNNIDMVACLINKPGEYIVEAQSKMFIWTPALFTPFTPTVEPCVEGAFLSTHPYFATVSGDLYRVPLIVSDTSAEGLYPAAFFQSNSSFLPELEERWIELARAIFVYNDTIPNTRWASVANKIKWRYLGGRPVSQETFSELVQALGDRLFLSNIGKFAKIYTSFNPVYFYFYTFRGAISLSVSLAQNDVNYGASHSDDLFHILEVPNEEITAPEDIQMTESLINIVYTFSTSGIPQPNTKVRWQPLTLAPDRVNYLEISSPTQYQIKYTYDYGNRTFWDSIGFFENENLICY